VSHTCVTAGPSSHALPLTQAGEARQPGSSPAAHYDERPRSARDSSNSSAMSTVQGAQARKRTWRSAGDGRCIIHETCATATLRRHPPLQPVPPRGTGPSPSPGGAGASAGPGTAVADGERRLRHSADVACSLTVGSQDELLEASPAAAGGVGCTAASTRPSQHARQTLPQANALTRP